MRRALLTAQSKKAIAFIRAHDGGNASGTGTTITCTLAGVDAGHTLVAVVAHRGNSSTGASSLSVPSGETAAWTQQVGRTLQWQDASSGRGAVSIWTITTTTTWAPGTAITATFGASNTVRLIRIAEFAGVGASLGTSAAGGNENVSTITVTSPTVAAGDLVVQACVSFGASISASHSASTATADSQDFDQSTPGGNLLMGGLAFLITGPGARSTTYTVSGTPKAAALLALAAA